MFLGSLLLVSAAFAAEPATSPIQVDLAAARQFSPSEQAALQAVADETSQVGSDALYVLLRHAMMLPEGVEAINEAERPLPRQLWQEPLRYRGRLICVTGRFVGKTLDQASQIQPNPFWDRPAFATYITAPDWPEPMIVVLPDRPADLARGAKVEVAGFFYKLLDQTSSRDAAKMGQYPVLVARRLYRPAVDLPGFKSPLAMIVGFGAVLAVIFLVLRKSTRRKLPGTLETLLHQHEAQDAADPKQVDQPVDEELTRQVEQYRKEHERH